MLISVHLMLRLTAMSVCYLSANNLRLVAFSGACVSLAQMVVLCKLYEIITVVV